jgi:thiamine biosynthesis lipoprotein
VTRAALILLALGGAVFAWVGFGSATAPPLRRAVSYTTRTMGTYGGVIIVTADSVRAAPAAEAAHRAFRRVDSLMTNWTTTSEVARLNRDAALAPCVVEPEVALVIDASLRIGEASDGTYDITVEPLVRLWGFLGGPKRVPSEHEIAEAFAHVGLEHLDFDRSSRTLRYSEPGVRIDLGGIAKGYAVDVAADTLLARGVRDGLVDVSGNMRALGAPVGSNHWRIGIRDPRDRMPYFAKLALSGGAISTSGKYEQFVAAGGKTYGHIMDPRTGRPAEGLISVTVVAPTALLADGWDTPLFVLGAATARKKALELDDVAAVLVVPGNGVDTVWVEGSLMDRFTLEPAARPLFHVERF